MENRNLQGLINEQRNELTACYLYSKLSKRIKNKRNAEVLKAISEDERKHYEKIRALTGKDVKPYRVQLWFFYFISIFFGLTFGVKLLEKSEERAVDVYSAMSKESKDKIDLNSILQDEQRHQYELIEMIDEERLSYVGSIVLGLNDALVELTGALAGYTFAFQNTNLIAVTGLITGIAASFSMAASEYLASVHEDSKNKKAKKSALYTGLAYVITVFLLILPFMLIGNPFISLIVTLCVAVLIILFFNYYISVAKGTPFKRRFLEMIVISLGVSGISFVVGIIIKSVFGVDI
jgi:VIT1/CCC1 family predicted Fe2+/Mn2+ transporter